MKPVSYSRIEPDDPVVEPVSLEEAKLHLRVDFSEDDDYITDLITAAREFCEEYTHRSFVPQNWRLGFSSWPSVPLWGPWSTRREFDLTRPPVFSVESLEYRAAGDDDDLTNLEVTRYKFDGDRIPGVIRFNRSDCLPSLSSAYPIPVQVVIKCGIIEDDDTPVVVSARIKMAIKQMLTQFYENRVPVIAGTIVSQVPLSALNLLSFDKIRKF